VRRVAVDITPLKVSRDLRLLVSGNLFTALGTQAALVALPYQVYVETGSAFLTGLLGAVELVPLIGMSLLGGAVADRMDRRLLLIAVQLGVALSAVVLALLALAGEPPLWSLYVLGGALAGFGGVQSLVRGAIVPNVVPAPMLRSALALVFGLNQTMYIIGPAVGGVIIGVWGVEAAYLLNAVTCVGMISAAVVMSPQRPRGVDLAGSGAERPSFFGSIAEGLSYVRGNQALKGSFAVDLMAMTFGMPRALFPVLAVSVYEAGAQGTGLLYAAVSGGAAVAALTTGWLSHARFLGRITLWAVAVWGASIAAAGLVGSLWLAALCLAVAGAADSVSAVCRSTINQTVTPDHMRGRMSSLYLLVVAGGPRVGDVEAGAVAGLAGPRFSVVSGGLACLVGVGVVALLFPALVKYDAEDYTASEDLVAA
jgi:ENTS family enterobactin (siderophore) exporter